MSETNVMRRILKACSRGSVRLFRNNTGTGWVGTGKPVRVSGESRVTMYPGDVLLRQARPLHAGLVIGSSDLIGWKSVVVTPDMLGKNAALFVAVECKDGKGRATKEQLNFIDFARAAGAIAGVARSEDDAFQILSIQKDQ